MSKFFKRRDRGFFSEVKTSTNLSTNWTYLLFLLGVILLWVFTAIPEQSNNASVYLFMLIVTGFITGFDALETRFGKMAEIAHVNGLGKKPLIAVAVGAGAMILISIVRPQTIIQPLSIISPETLSFLFIVVAAPLVEAGFFRGTLQPITVHLLQEAGLGVLVAGGAATVIQSLIFAFFHISVFGQGGDFMPYFIFGVIATIGVYAFKSIGFEYGLHGVNNLLAWMG